MTANNDPISNAFGITPLGTPNKVEKIIADAHNDSARNDFEIARSNLIDVIETAKDAIDNLAQIATSSQQPRAYEVLAKLIDTTTNTSKSLLDLQEKIRELNKIDEPHNEKAKTVNNNLFVGSTAELQKILKQMKDE